MLRGGTFRVVSSTKGVRLTLQEGKLIHLVSDVDGDYDSDGFGDGDGAIDITRW
jgi:hypothetical protein